MCLFGADEEVCSNVNQALFGIEEDEEEGDPSMSTRHSSELKRMKKKEILPSNYEHKH